jgi:methionine-S-sulfoxide reductase
MLEDNSDMTKQTAIIAAGCFWGVQYYFDQVPGVLSTAVGYTGGHKQNPTYEDVCYTDTGHAEAVRVEFDPEVLSYEKLLLHFFRIHDPTQLNRQGPDVGEQYRSAIFYTDDSQKKITKDIIASLQRNYKKPIVTQLVPAVTFFLAEDYHQKFTQRTGRGMCHVAYKEI